jgi:hypothetical protein
MWYNGYNFYGNEIYNPFSISKFITYRVLDNYWTGTGDPQLILELFKKMEYY